GADGAAVAEHQHLGADALRRRAGGRDDGDQRRRLPALERVGDGGKDFAVHAMVIIRGAGRAGGAGGLRSQSVPYLPYLPYLTCVHRCRSHTAVGSVPDRNASLKVFGHEAVESLPFSGSMSTKLMPSGTSKGRLGGPGSAGRLTCVHSGR